MTEFGTRALALTLFVSLLGLANAQTQEVVTEDLSIGHQSTVPVNRGAQVELFLRHYRPAEGSGGAVVALSSDLLPAAAGLGLDLEGYDHLESLAAMGFDVFAADVTGYGLSPKPQMDDGCNASHDQQNALLIPYPLYIPCETAYPRLLTSLRTDWDEVTTIVDDVQDLTGEESVSLLGWGRGATRAAGFAALHPEQVEKLVLIAPVYDPDAPAQVPSPYPEGNPLVVHSVDGLMDEWRESAQCEDWAQYEEVADALRRQLPELDPNAAEWGYQPGNLVRSPGTVEDAGFNQEQASSIGAPTLVLSGSDNPEREQAEALFDDLGGEDKLMLEFECGTRWLIWGGARQQVTEAIGEFLQSGTVSGQESGRIEVSRDGEYR